MEQRQSWFKFYPQDWLGDELLRSCLPATRGFWMDCLCIMHRATPRGHLVVNGQGPTDRELATMSGMTVSEMRTARAEIQRKGVCGITEAGVLFSRRMVRDTARSQQAHVWGTAGGNPSLKANDNHSPQQKDKAHHKQTRDRVPEARDPESQKDQPPPSPSTPKKEKPVFDSGPFAVFPWMEAEFTKLLQIAGREDFSLFDWYGDVARELEAAGQSIRSDGMAYLRQRLYRDVPLPKPSLAKARQAAKGAPSLLTQMLAMAVSDEAKWALRHVCQVQQRDGVVCLTVPAKYRPALEAERARLERAASAAALEILEAEP